VSLTLRISPEAEEQAEYLGEWWREHRPAARSLKDLLAETFAAIESAPNGSPVYATIDGEVVRYRMIKSTPYAAFYYVDAGREVAVIISVWSLQRGERPPVRVR
jgi:plasmid stabilization system protein ParE